VLLLATVLAGSIFFVPPSEAGAQTTAHGGQAGLAEGKFLVADRSMADVRFQRAVILLVSYDNDGAMGLIVNLPTTVKLSRLFPGIKGLHKRTDHVSIGGPVAGNQLFMLVKAASAPEGAYHIFKNTYLSTDLSLLEKISALPEKEGRFRVFAGYAGWAAGQLEREVARGEWHILTADEETLYDKDPSTIWEELITLGSGTWVNVR